MKNCSNCGYTFDGPGNFCPQCGARIEEISYSQESETPNNVEDEEKKIKDNEFVQALKQDVGNSQSINMIKNKFESTSEKIKSADDRKKKKFLIIGIIAAAIIVLLVIVTNIHQCEECEKIYFGKRHTISFFGESENVCKDCYNDFYSWDW